MSLLISVKSIEKTMGSKLLFENLSFGVFEGEKIGLIGPNGAGKSTLLRLLALQDTPDEGEINQKRNLVVAYVAQGLEFDETLTAHSIVKTHLLKHHKEELEAEVQASVSLSIAGFEDPQIEVATLSGGWRKRLSLAMAIALEPDLLILDEPTNHMDWDGILWLESWLKSFKGSLLLVSHDRSFLDSSTNRIIEINRLYRDGYLSFDCSYHKFLERKDEYIQTQLKLEDSLANKARREVDWLRAGVKARTTKSQSRIDKAHALLDNLQQVKSRNLSAKAKSRIQIDSSGRKAKKLIELTNVSVAYDDLKLIDNLDLLLGPKTCLGILGHNGSGKTSLLKVIQGQASNYTGQVFLADDLRIVYFDQKRETIPQDKNLVEFLGNGSDYTMFKDQSIHVAAYASRFLFTSEKMHLKISQLSGGEQARLLIAKLLLQPADVLILDEPTNDLDIETIEILEETLIDFEGLVLLVSHDRFFMSQICNRFLALDGQGGWNEYPNLDQWLRHQSTDGSSSKKEKPVEEKRESKKARLSYNEKRRLENIEVEIEQAEQKLKNLQETMQDPQIMQDNIKLQEIASQFSQQQKAVEDLYSLWDELEAKR